MLTMSPPLREGQILLIPQITMMQGSHVVSEHNGVQLQITPDNCCLASLHHTLYLMGVLKDEDGVLLLLINEFDISCQYLDEKSNGKTNGPVRATSI